MIPQKYDAVDSALWRDVGCVFVFFRKGYQAEFLKEVVLRGRKGNVA